MFEQRVDRIEKFSLSVSEMQSSLVAMLRKSMDDGINEAIEYAGNQINMIKSQFTSMFDELDALIKQKYEELEECINDQKSSEEKLENNKNILLWIESCKENMERVLEI